MNRPVNRGLLRFAGQTSPAPALRDTVAVLRDTAAILRLIQIYHYNRKAGARCIYARVAGSLGAAAASPLRSGMRSTPSISKGSARAAAVSDARVFSCGASSSSFLGKMSGNS